MTDSKELFPKPEFFADIVNEIEKRLYRMDRSKLDMSEILNILSRILGLEFTGHADNYQIELEIDKLCKFFTTFFCKILTSSEIVKFCNDPRSQQIIDKLTIFPPHEKTLLTPIKGESRRNEINLRKAAAIEETGKKKRILRD